MNKTAYGLGVIHGYIGVIYDNPYFTDYDADSYDEGYAYGESMREEEEVESSQRRYKQFCTHNGLMHTPVLLQMRSDLAAEGIEIPAFDDFMKATYLEADEVKGAEYVGAYGDHFTRLRLRDNRVFYFVNADLENCDGEIRKCA